MIKKKHKQLCWTCWSEMNNSLLCPTSTLLEGAVKGVRPKEVFEADSDKFHCSVHIPEAKQAKLSGPPSERVSEEKANFTWSLLKSSSRHKSHRHRHKTKRVREKERQKERKRKREKKKKQKREREREVSRVAQEYPMFQHDWEFTPDKWRVQDSTGFPFPASSVPDQHQMQWLSV